MTLKSFGKAADSLSILTHTVTLELILTVLVFHVAGTVPLVQVFTVG
jgi:hypothetical protein